MKDIRICMVSDDDFSEEECEDLRYRMKEGHLKRMEDNCFCSHNCRDRKEQIKDLKPLKQGMPNKVEERPRSSSFMITPNGWFATQKRICLSMSDFHSETWNPMWSVAR
ncbi:uncharacterized protein LOC131232918 [Magnolia sinica]|uniref:uncharacterized protein LOC131232918 n=1 Tax=Magnolia sinica TaxID=86752 RepID=UPI00265AB278|nr:uncharacterized protein LOC131232918 [Magnolia sinica]